MIEPWIVPNWPAPNKVRALITTRSGGVSQGIYDSMNLGDHVGDEAASVAQNRALLHAHLPAEPKWLQQVHGTVVANADTLSDVAQADASIAQRAGTVCTVLTADCLPVLLCDENASAVGAAHAGWRGLAAGVIEATVAAMRVEPAHLMAYLGPAIGPQAFEVGGEVRQIFIAADPAAAQAFVPTAKDPTKWLADIYQLARLRLKKLGVQRVYGGDFCTYSDASRFYSYRRDGATGRMASLIWLAG